VQRSAAPALYSRTNATAGPPSRRFSRSKNYQDVHPAPAGRSSIQAMERGPGLICGARS
jgi:hypothetical protein